MRAEQNIKTFELQYKEGEDWKKLYSGTTIGAKAELVVPPTEAKLIRLVIKSFSDTPGIYEIMIYNE